VLQGVGSPCPWFESYLKPLRSLAINAIRLDGIWSITEGIAALAHGIKGLLRLLGWTEPATATPSG
jgi:hypothetical protein